MDYAPPLPNLRFIEKIGIGGMSTVWLMKSMVPFFPANRPGPSPLTDGLEGP